MGKIIHHLIFIKAAFFAIVRCILLKISQTSSKLCGKVKKGKRTDNSFLLGTERQWTGKVDPCSFEAPNPSSLPDPDGGKGWSHSGGAVWLSVYPVSGTRCARVLRRVIVSWNWFNLNYLSIFALIILGQKKKKLRQRNCRLETLFSGQNDTDK